MGLSPYRDRLDVWMEKTHHPLWVPKRETPAMYWGNVLEPVVAAEWQKRHPEFDLRYTREQPVYWHPNGVQFGHLDAPIFAGDELVGIWEGKTSDDAFLWQDGPPPHVQVQVQQYMAVKDLPWTWVSCHMAGDPLRYREWLIEQNLEDQLDIEGEVTWFWNNYVVTGLPPDRVPNLILSPRSDPEEQYLAASSEQITLVEQMFEMDRLIDELEQDKHVIREQIKKIIGPAPGLQGPGFRVDYKSTNPSRKVGWEQVAVSLWNVLAVMRRFEAQMPEDVKPYLDRGLYDQLIGLYTEIGPPGRPFTPRRVK